MAISKDLLAPLAYVILLVTALGIFSSVYRRRKAAAAVEESWFPPHTARDLYITLVQTVPPPPESILKSALLVRAITDVRRIFSIRESKSVLQNLIAKGSIGDDLLVKFARAEKELEAEILDVVNEANSFTPAWGPTIFASATEMVAGEKLRTDFNGIGAIKAEQDLLAGLANPPVQPTTLNPASDPSSQASSPTTSIRGTPKKKAKK